MRWVWAFCLVCLFTYTAYGQKHTQLWLDYQVRYPFGSNYLFDVEASYQKLLLRDSTWRSINLTPKLEYAVATSFDLRVSLPLAYTAQAKGYNSFEVRPTIEGVYYISQNKRVNTAVSVKIEERVFRNVEGDDWETSERVRLKGAALISINGPNLYQDKLWYAIADYEEFFVTDQDLDERYANRRRARIGAGYRLDYKHRFEALYTLQTSRDEVNDEFTGTDNVIQLRYIMYLNPSKPLNPSTE